MEQQLSPATACVIATGIVALCVVSVTALLTGTDGAVLAATVAGISAAIAFAAGKLPLTKK